MRTILALCALLSLTAFGQLSTFQSLQQVLTNDPRGLTIGGRALVAVQGKTTPGDLGRSRLMVHLTNAPFSTNATHRFSDGRGGMWWFPDENEPTQNATYWNVDMTGATDTTTAVQAMLNAVTNHTIEFPPGTMLLRRVGISNTITLRGNRTVVKMLETNSPFFVAAHDVTIENFVFDGENKWPFGIGVQSNIFNTTIAGNRIVNLYSSNWPIMSVGIHSLGSGGLRVLNNVISNVNAEPDGVIGGQPGMVRGIYVEAPYGSGRAGGAPVFVQITGNFISDLDRISAEDSDAIVVSGGPQQDWHNNSASGFISDNTITNAGKRAIKISGSGYVIAYNHNRNNYDGSTQPTGWLPTSGKKRQLEFGANFGNHNIWIGNDHFGGAIESFIGMASNDVSSSYCTFIGNRQKFNPAVLWTNNTCEGFASFGTSATNIVIIGNDLDVVTTAFRSYAPDRNWVVSGNIFRHVFGTNGMQFYDAASDTWATAGTGFILGPTIDSYNQFRKLSPSNIVIEAVEGHHIVNNIFDNFTSIGLVSRATNVTIEDNKLVNGVGELSDSPWVPALTLGGTNYFEFVTNKYGGSYSWSKNVKYGVFGQKAKPYQWYAIESHGPILLDTLSYYDESYATHLTNEGAMAWFTIPGGPGYRVIGYSNGVQIVTRTNFAFAASNNVVLATNMAVTTTTNQIRTHFEFPELFTYKQSNAGWNDTNWIRIAAMESSLGLGNRYGATIVVEPAGGPTATTPVTFRVELNQGEGSITLLNSPWADAPLYDTNRTFYGQPPFVQSIRLVVQTNVASYVDILPGSYRAAGVYYGVKVLSDLTDQLGYSTVGAHGAHWRVGGLTNVTLGASEAAIVTMTNLYTKLFAFGNGQHILFNYPSFAGTSYTILNPREFSFGVESNTLVLNLQGLAGFNIRSPFVQWNGTNLGTGSGSSYSFTNGVAYTNGQVQLNMAYTGGITATTNSWGQVTLAGPPASTNSGSVVSQNGAYFPIVNIKDASTISWTSSSGSNFLAAVVAGSLSTNLLDATAYSLLMQGLGLQYAYLNSNQTFSANNTFTGAFDSPGAGGSSFKAGSGAAAAGASGVAVGPGASASAQGGVALGQNALASGFQGVALGGAATAQWASSVGNNLASGEYSTALGASAQALSSFSSAIGAYATSTRSNQTMIGPTFLSAVDSAHEVVTQGKFVSSNGALFQVGTSNKLQLSSSGIDFAGSGKAFRYNNTNVLMEPPSDNTVYGFSNGIPVAVSAGSSGGGLGTNLFVNNVLKQPAKLTNSAALTGGLVWLTNAAGDIYAYATNIGAGSGYLPLSAGSSFPLTDSLYFLSPATATQIILGNTADIGAGRRYVGLQSSSGRFQVFDMTTNTFVVQQTLFDIDPRDANTNVFTIGTTGGREDWMVFDTDRVWIKQGKLEIQTTNVMDEINLRAKTVTTTQGDMVARGSSADQRIAPGFMGDIVLYDGTDAKFYSPSQFTTYFDDLIYQGAPGSGAAAPVAFVSNGTGAAATIITSEADAPGIIQLSDGTGTTTANNCRGQWGSTYLFGSAPIYLEWRVRIQALSSAVESYELHVGFYDNTSGAPVDGAEFYYTHSNNSGNWTERVRSNSSTVGSDVNSSSGFAANTWVRLGVLVNSSANSFKFYVNRVLDGTVTGSGPTGAGRETTPRVVIASTGGSTGTAADTVQIDYVLAAYQISR